MVEVGPGWGTLPQVREAAAGVDGVFVDETQLPWGFVSLVSSSRGAVEAARARLVEIVEREARA